MEPNRADLGDSQCKTPGGVFADGRKHLLALELCHSELFAGRSWLLRALSDRVSPWTARKIMGDGQSSTEWRRRGLATQQQFSSHGEYPAYAVIASLN